MVYQFFLIFHTTIDNFHTFHTYNGIKIDNYCFVENVLPLKLLTIKLAEL